MSAQNSLNIFKLHICHGKQTYTHVQCLRTYVNAQCYMLQLQYMSRITDALFFGGVIGFSIS